jgi:hypothetical protein
MKTKSSSGAKKPKAKLGVKTLAIFSANLELLKKLGAMQAPGTVTEMGSHGDWSTGSFAPGAGDTKVSFTIPLWMVQNDQPGKSVDALIVWDRVTVEDNGTVLGNGYLESRPHSSAATIWDCSFVMRTDGVKITKFLRKTLL